MQALDNMSHRFGRDGPLDGVANLRSLFQLGASQETWSSSSKRLRLRLFDFSSRHDMT